MNEDGQEKTDTPSPGDPKPVRFILGTLESSRNTFARVLKAFSKGNIGTERYKNYVYGFTAYLAYLKLERECDIEKRLDALEAEQKARAE